MCRPSCCDNSRGQGAGIAAVALIAIGTLIVAKIAHIALEVIRITALTAAAVLVVAVAAWLAVMTMRWWLRHRRAQLQATPQPVNATIWQTAPAGDQHECLACGGSQKVLQLIDGSRYQPGACPVCEPAQWAG